MAHWQQYNIEERLQLLDIASAEKNLPKLAIEKDWWVTMVLKALSQTQYSNLFSYKARWTICLYWNIKYSACKSKTHSPSLCCKRITS
jgi:hypothetical protein